MEMEGQAELRYLGQKEKDRSRKLWEQCFKEDSSRFLDYYYKEKCKDNQILVLEHFNGYGDSEREVISMVQRNPYPVFWEGREYLLDYIVGVATEPQWRHQGCMRTLLNHMLADQNREQMPFTFLMPADPAIYQPFGFSYVYQQPDFCLNGKGELLRRERVRGEAQAAETGAWLNRWLENRYSAFALRTPAYMARLWKEIESEYGKWDLLYDGEEMVGMECFWGKEKPQRRFLYAEEAYLEKVCETRPAIMARIVNLNEFMGNVRLKGKEQRVEIGIVDEQIPENHGLFSWKITQGGSEIRKIGSEIPKEAWTISIGDLTQWMLGYGCQPNSWGITAGSRIFLDEIV
jgi:predicted acetyltransferase